MKLLRIEVLSVRGLADAAFDLPAPTGRGSRLVVTGRPGCGATSFLKSIVAVASSLSFHASPPRDVDVIRSSRSSATIRTTWQLDEDEMRDAGLRDGRVDAVVTYERAGLGRAASDPGLLAAMSRYDHSGETSKVVFVPERRAEAGSIVGLSDFLSEMKRLQFSSACTKFAAIERALVDARSPAARARFEKTQALFGEITRSCRLTRASQSELEFTTARGDRVGLSDLSHSERHALFLAAAPFLLGLRRAVVLVDQPELGLDPAEVPRIMDLVIAAAPESQWIMATRNQGLVAAAPPGAIIDLEKLS